jgi:hypothetical protein
MQTRTQPTPARSYAGYQFECANCEMEIDGKPEFHLGLAFCCAGCAVSGPCTCSYDDRPSAAAIKAASQLCDCHRVAASMETVEANKRHWLMEPVPALGRR